MSSGNDALLDDYDEADSLDDVMRKSRDNFPKMCDSKNEAGEFDNSLHEARLNYMATRMIAKMLSAKHSTGVTQRVMMNQR